MSVYPAGAPCICVSRGTTLGMIIHLLYPKFIFCVLMNYLHMQAICISRTSYCIITVFMHFVVSVHFL
jgi:hypothetical protein